VTLSVKEEQGSPTAALSFVLEDFLSFETGSRVHDRRAGVAAISIVIKLQITHSRNLKNTTTTHSNSYSCHMNQVNIFNGFSGRVGRDKKSRLCAISEGHAILKFHKVFANIIIESRIHL
jgi:hypothetical protein